MHQIEPESNLSTTDDDSLYPYINNDIEYRLFEDIVDSYYLDNNNNNNLFNVYTYNDHPYILLFSFIILCNTHIYVRVTLSQKAVSETDRVPIIVFTILLALHLYTKYVYKLPLHLEICVL